MNKAIYILWISLAVICFTATVAARQANNQNILNSAPYQRARSVGTITSTLLGEASGMAVSHQNDDILWMINDSGNPALLFAVRASGQLVDTFSISQAINRDWEDLASFCLKGIPYLLIADVGDNAAIREVCSLYIVREPVIAAAWGQNIKQVQLERQIEFRYADGPRDCEAVAVDSDQKRVLLMSKRTKPPILYELPLKTESSKKRHTARPIAEIKTIPPPTRGDLKKRYGQYFSQPTAMDLSPDGTTLIVLTYKAAYYFRRNAGESWQQALNSAPLRIDLPHPDTGLLKQREALAIDHRSGSLFVTSEGIPASIFCLQPKKNSGKVKEDNFLLGR